VKISFICSLIEISSLNGKIINELKKIALKMTIDLIVNEADNFLLFLWKLKMQHTL
jgi:hypothetical protein